MKKTMAILVLALCLALSACDNAGMVVAADERVPISKWHSLAIGQEMTLPGDGERIRRVPGGWVFFYERGYGSAVCFVPLSDEGKE